VCLCGLCVFVCVCVCVSDNTGPLFAIHISDISLKTTKFYFI